MKKKNPRRKPRPSKRKTPVAVRFRLMWVIPLVFALFTLASGYFALNFSKYFFLPPRYPSYGEGEASLWILLGIYLIAALAAASGAIIAHAVTKPLKKLSERAELLAPGKAIKAPDELSLLNQTLEEVFSSLDRYMEEGKSMDVLPEGAITLDRNGNITHLNKAAEKTLGVESPRVEGANFRTVFHESPGNRMFLNLIDNSLNNGIAEVFDNAEIPQGDGYVKLKGRVTPRRDDADRPAGLVITFADPFEMEHIRNWIKQADQMAGLGTMAAGFAHEIRNPLASIRGLMELIREDLPDTDTKKKYADAIIKEVDRVNNLVEEVLDFTHTESSAPEPMDVNNLLKQAVNTSKHRIPEKTIGVIENFGRNLPPVLARPEKLTQAFINLFVNAIEATPEGGIIRITSTTEDGARHSAAEDSRPTRLIVRFHNSGSFIPPEDIERVFLPFFTTRADGTGLGLPITHRIIAAHGGKIKVKSAREAGTTFEIELPTFTEVPSGYDRQDTCS